MVLTDDDGVSTEIQVDNETRAALLLFNERIDEARAEERAAKRVAKAERQKDEAAGRVRKLGNDSSATAEQKAEAESAYKAAVEEFNRISENPDAETEKPPPSEDSAVETEPTETSADEEPAMAEAVAASDESE